MAKKFFYSVIFLVISLAAHADPPEDLGFFIRTINEQPFLEKLRFSEAIKKLVNVPDGEIDLTSNYEAELARLKAFLEQKFPSLFG